MRTLVEVGRLPLRIALEWKAADCWVGAYWDRRGALLNVWVCLLPCLPIHVKLLRRMPPLRQRGTFPGDLDRMPSGHTRHREARMQWGDGECECGAAPSPTPSPAAQEEAPDPEPLREMVEAELAEEHRQERIRVADLDGSKHYVDDPAPSPAAKEETPA